MPESDRSIMILSIGMPVGTSLEQTDNASRLVEEVLMEKAGDSIVSATSFVGQSDDMAEGASMGMGGGINEAMVLIRLKDKEDRKLSNARITEIVRQNKPPIKGLEISSMDMAGMMMGGANTPIEIKIFGKDLKVLEEVSEKIADKIKDVEGVRDIDTTLSQGKPELSITIDRERASYLGLTVGQIGSAVKNSNARLSCHSA